ncbi:MAG: hypothetical protein AAGB04_23490 [Pseudomonadota bacterium]
MRNLVIPAVLGALLVTATAASRDADGQEALGSSLAKKPFQSVVGQTSTLRGLIEQARPLPERAEFVRHFGALELANRVYREQLEPGSFIFGSDVIRREYERLNALRTKGAVLTLSAQIKRALFEALAWQPVYHWQVLEYAAEGKVQGECPQTRRELTANDWKGFQAVTYINHQSKRIVVAIAGTDPASKADVFNDWVALTGRVAPHFDVSCAYFQHVIRQYGSRFAGYSFACSGHSLGGGACSVAASRLGRMGIALNPIGTHQQIKGQVLPQQSTMVNYIDPKDFALDLYRRFNRHPDGRVYWIADKPVSRDLLQSFLQLLRRQPKIVRLWDSYLAHSATLSLDRLAKIQKLQRLK